MTTPNSTINTQIVVSKTRVEFIQDVQRWVLVDTQLKKITEKTKEFREYRSRLSTDICEYITANNHDETKIEITNGEIKMVDKKDYSPLTFEYIETTLGKIIKDKSQVEYIIQTLKENRKITVHKDLRCILQKPDKSIP